MKEFIVKNFSGFAVCRFQEIVYPSQTPQFTYTFTPGAYAFSGQIDNGGWAFTYSLTALYEKDVCVYGSSEFIIDDKFVSLDFLRSKSCYLGCPKTNQSAKKQFSKIEKNQKLKKPLEEIKQMFGLTDERFDMPLDMTGNELWRITAALGYAQDKKIFCYPWRTNNQLKAQLYTIQKMANIFANNNCYLFLPVENDALLKEYVNDVLDLSQPQIYGG